MGKEGRKRPGSPGDAHDNDALTVHKTFTVDAPRRVTGFSHEGRTPAVVQSALNPVQLLLLVKPGLRNRMRAKGALAPQKKFEHDECVIALCVLDPEPRPDSDEEYPGHAWATSPRPAVPTVTLCLDYSDDVPAPSRFHPVKDASVSVSHCNLDGVVEAVSDRRESPSDGDAAFAVDKSGRVRPISVPNLGHRLSSGGALQRRLGVQAAQEDLERQRRGFEVTSEQVQVGSGLLEAGDRELDHPH